VLTLELRGRRDLVAGAETNVRDFGDLRLVDELVAGFLRELHFPVQQERCLAE